MKRTNVSLAQIADWDNLINSTWKAASGRRCRSQVLAFVAKLDENLRELRRAILTENIVIQPSRVFHIRDPKPRMIHAPTFRDRVLHHAIMAHVGPILDRSLVDDTFACRKRKGTLAAIQRAQQHSRRYPWYVKLDVHQYFHSINHVVLKDALRRQVKGNACLRLLDRVIDANSGDESQGLPIGALTSQHFANFYLSALDRQVMEELGSCAMVRYMDDVIVWCRSNGQAAQIANATSFFLNERLKLRWNLPIQIQRSLAGLTLCGFRIFPGTIRVARSRRLRLIRSLNRWEWQFVVGRATGNQLQRAYDSILGMMVHVDAARWLKRLFVLRAVDRRNDSG